MTGNDALGLPAGPVTSEEHAVSLPAVLAIYEAAGDGSATAPNTALLIAAVAEAGLVFGSFDLFVLDWLATSSNPETVATIASWITRAAAGGAQ